jgi:hypothetical protein
LEWVCDDQPVGRVAIDRKRLRGSASAGHGGSEGVPLVAAFAARLGGVIGQLRVEPGGSEITAALALLKSLPFDGTTIIGMLPFCQRAICQRIRVGNGTIYSRSGPTSPN